MHFSKKIVNKIATIRSKFQDKSSVQKPEIKSKMKSFERATEDEIKKAYFELIVKIM